MATIAFYSLEPWQKEYITAKLKGHSLSLNTEPLSEKNVTKAKTADALAVFIYSKVTKELLANMPELKLVTTMSTGFDHIDLETCKKKKITVCNVPAYGDHTVAEHTFALMLAVTRKIVDSIELTRSGKFDFKGLLGNDLYGKTLGIVGTGKIGRNVAHIGGAFGMKIIAFDVIQNKEWANECGVQYVPFDNLIAESDIITFHVPLTKETTHLLNSKNVGKVKKGAVIINTARGGIIETKALVEGLNKGIISGVGLDVIEEECELKEGKTPNACSMLLNHPRALITPHSAFYSKEAVQRILDTTVENINAFLAKKPVNVVS